jgi:hypothetical protein
MKYEFGALQKQIFIMVGLEVGVGAGGQKYCARDLLSIFALHDTANLLKPSV